MDPKYLRPGVDFALAHVVEECGELVSAIGKSQRWGLNSTNPELPREKQETNREWVLREMVDVRGALDRLEPYLRSELGPVAPSGSGEEGADILIHALTRIVGHKWPTASLDRLDGLQKIAQTALDAYRESTIPLKILVDSDWLRAKIETDPDVDTEATSPSDWFPWHGGECPCPGAVVEIKTHNCSYPADYADQCLWEHVPNDNHNIIAYRIVTPAPQPEPSKGGDAQSTSPAYDEAPEEQSSGAVEWPDDETVERVARRFKEIGISYKPNSIEWDDWYRLCAKNALYAAGPPPIPHDWREKMRGHLSSWREFGDGTFDHFVNSLQSKIAEWEKEG